MTKREFLAKLETLLAEAHTAILATTDQSGNPHMRWMTPTFIKGKPGAIYAVTSSNFGKVTQLKTHPNVEWMLQSPALDVIISIKGKMNLLDNPSIRSEVLEAVGPSLRVFWKINQAERDLLVLETIIEETTFYLPMQGTKQTIKYNREDFYAG